MCGSTSVGQIGPGQAGRGREEKVATPERRYGPGAGISVGGIIVVIGILLLIFWSWIIGLIVILVGLVAFGGFARGRWY